MPHPDKTYQYIPNEPLGIPMGYVYIVIPITGVVIAVYGVLNVICLIRKGEEA